MIVYFRLMGLLTLFQNGFNYVTEELLDGVANRITILSELFREGAGVDVSTFSCLSQTLSRVLTILPGT